MSQNGSASTNVAQALAALSPEQRTLLQERLRDAGLGAPDVQCIPRRLSSVPAPLSFAQQRLWFLQRLEPGSAAYNIPFATRLTGALDPVALQRALQTIVDRHESLRTTVAQLDDVPIQVIAPSASVPLPVTDLTALSETERERELGRLAVKEARAPFNLETGPVLRCQLVRLGHQDHALLLTVHHIASDGWSMGVLFRELGTLYRAAIAGQASPLLDLPLQYADYAVWQRGESQSQKLEGQLVYWRQRLMGAPPRLELPTERTTSGRPAGRAAKATLALPIRLADELKALSRREGVTLFMTLLAAFKILLARYSGQDDIVVGTPISGRSHVELEGLIGCFLNTLVLRTDLSGQPTFKELLTRVRETALGAYAHQELPFERLVEDLQPARDLSQNPLFQVLFQAGNTLDGALRLDGLEVSRVSGGGIDSKFDLSFRVRDGKAGLLCTCSGNPGLFGVETLACLLDQFHGLLEQIIRFPGQSIPAYSLITNTTRAALPDPQVVLPQHSYPPVTEVVRQVAKAAPSRTAVEQAERCWSYGDLATAVDALTQRLEQAGLTRGAVVGISGPSSFGLVSSMLAVLSSGGVLLPIGPELPEHRKHLMLQEAGAKLLLRIGGVEEDRPLSWPVDVVRVCDHTGEVEGNLPHLGDARPAGSPPGTDDPAYIFFTSGTTSTPKGVLGVHQGLSHLLDWQSQTFAVGSADRCAQLTNISFDVVLRDILMPLWSGATLCLPPAELLPESVPAWLAAENITLVHSVPSLAQAWLADTAPGLSLPSLRWVFSAGEPLTDALVLRWRGVAPNCQAINLYGPTETTMIKCWYRVPDDVAPGVQPVGQSLPQSQALVLSSTNQLCGINEIGEIVLRTPFRTRGYINAPEAQRHHFIANPFTNDSHDVLYRTGDFGRYRHDGSLTVLGRLDQQVKIRGVRIEPEEVTAVLAAHPRVSACSVIGRPDRQGETVLVAYVARTGNPVSTTELRAFLAERLPAAMVPTAFVFLSSLPLTPNGKLDRRALPEPEQGDASLEQPYVAPRTPIEALLAQMWADVLRVPRVGVDDDFFRLGGHSLSATQVIARTRAAFGIELPLRSMFETPTVAGLALTVARRLIETSETTNE
jgi:amino acid adenylation domain-containing protein